MTSATLQSKARGGQAAAPEQSDLQKQIEREYTRCLSTGMVRPAAAFKHAMDLGLHGQGIEFARALVSLKRFPVTIDEFVESNEFLAGVTKIWRPLREDLRAMNPDVFTGDNPITEALLGGATGTGKTTLALVTTAYQLYLLTCCRDPQGLYDLASSTPIVILMQSVSPQVTDRVIYQPFRDMFLAMRYAKKHLKWDEKKQQTLELEGGISVRPALANVQAMVGQAVISGILDEVNFMDIVEESKRIPGPRGLGGRYDQAQETFSNLSRRRKSRFATQGVSIGCLSILSSTRYRDDFLDRRMAEAESLNEPNVFISRRKQYEVVPNTRFSGETFRLLVGSDKHQTRILGPQEKAPPKTTVETIPIELKVEFERDPENALRDIVGLASDAITPFISRPDTIVDAFAQGRELGLRHWVDRPYVELAHVGIPLWVPERLPHDRDVPRYAHVDLSLSGDTCGIAIVKYLGHVHIDDEAAPGAVESLPKFAVECVIGLKPCREAEIDLADVRSWLLQLQTRFDLNIRSITYDGYQSAEGIQALKKLGVRSTRLSVDREPEPYLYLKRNLARGLIAMVESEHLHRELAQLEFRANKDKIDHPPRGSKDLADAVCGAIYFAAKSRPVRNRTVYSDDSGDPATTRGQKKRKRGTPRRRSLQQEIDDWYRDNDW